MFVFVVQFYGFELYFIIKSRKIRYLNNTYKIETYSPFYTNLDNYRNLIFITFYRGIYIMTKRRTPTRIFMTNIHYFWNIIFSCRSGSVSSDFIILYFIKFMKFIFTDIIFFFYAKFNLTNWLYVYRHSVLNIKKIF